jgi:hypothetical protein
MEDFFKFFNALPPPTMTALATLGGAVIGALAGIVGGILGAVIANRGNNRRLQNQLDYDAKQRDREREMVLRREVYLKAAEVVAEAHTTIIKLPSMNLQDIQNINIGIDLGNILNKINIVGTERTVEAITNYNEEFLRVYFRACIKAMELNILRGEINSIDEEMKFAQGDVDRLTSLEETKSQKQLFEAKERFAFMEKCFDDMEIMQKLLVESNLAIRKELDIEINEQFYRNLMAQSRERLKEEMNLHMEAIKTRVPALR